MNLTKSELYNIVRQYDEIIILILGTKCYRQKYLLN